ncbi:MAG: glycosyltransferase family 2 protein [Candidatus Thermoplasmatota archaeon]|jgi:glycosyltransferase involved in cell wall biosynthesis|nr:glycosyltransferase family 2 protein [Candidatus Thermoplasmatota archaeon]
MTNTKKHSIAIIPCYNEEPTIGSIVAKAKHYVNEVLVVDDGSNDNTAEIAKEVGATVITHETNKGKTEAIKTGFKYALKNNYDYIITMDGDAQHNPSEIPVLLNNLINNGHDITLGVRYGLYTEMPLWRKFGKRVLDYTTSFGNGGIITDSQCGFRAFNKKAVEKILPKLNGHSFTVESEQLIRAHEENLKIDKQNISCKYKNLNTSTKKPLSHGLSVLIEVLKLLLEKRPLFLIVIPGIISLFFGLLLGLITIMFYNDTYIFNIGLALIVSILIITGILTIIKGLSKKYISIALKEMFREKIY